MPNLTCCSCGESAGEFAQHWNRDTGFGVCRSCVDNQIAKGVPASEIESLYGKEGVNYAATPEAPRGIFDYQYVLASANGRGCFNFYPTMTAARDDMARTNREYAYMSDAPYEPMTYNEFKRRERHFWLDDPPIQVTAEKWNDALEVLPPLRWTQQPGYNSFLMSEMMTGTFTNQYVRYGTRDSGFSYWSKMVDAADRATWLQPGKCPVVIMERKATRA